MSIEMILAILEAVGAKDFLIEAFKGSEKKEWSQAEIIEFIADANAKEDEFDEQFTADDGLIESETD